jgi:hypothetical protein
MRDLARYGRLAILLLLLLSLVLVSCGGREEEAVPEEDKAPPTLPRISVQIDENGVPTVFGISVETIGNLLRQDLSTYYLPADVVQQLVDGGVQHLEVVVVGDGIYLFSNGEPLPYLAMDEESRGNIDDLARLANVPNAETIQWVTDNILARIGLPLVLQMPLPEGTDEVPLRDTRTLARVKIDGARAGVDAPSLVFYADVALDDNGEPTLAGLSLGQLQDALLAEGVNVDLSAAMVDPALVQSLRAAGVQNVQVETEPEGLYLYMNGEALPRIAWDDERLQNAATLYESLDSDSPYLPLLKFLLPSIQPADVEITVLLPRSTDADALSPRPFISPQ